METEVSSPGGTDWRLKHSPVNTRGEGWLGVAQLRPGQFHAKVNVEGFTDGQQFVPGGYCKTSQEAALRYTKYMAAPYPITKKDPERADKGKGRVRAAFLFASPSHDFLMCTSRVASVHCGQKRGRKAASASEKNEEVPPTVPPTEMPSWVVCSNTLFFWKKGVELPAELQLGAVAAAQVMRIKAFAAAQMEQLQAKQQQQQEEEEEE